MADNKERTANVLQTAEELHKTFPVLSHVLIVADNMTDMLDEWVDCIGIVAGGAFPSTCDKYDYTPPPIGSPKGTHGTYSNEEENVPCMRIPVKIVGNNQEIWHDGDTHFFMPQDLRPTDKPTHYE